MYDTSVSYSNPYRVFADLDGAEFDDMEQGDPVKVEFEKGDESYEAICLIDGIDQFETEQENHAVFYLASALSEEASPDRFNIFDEYREENDLENHFNNYSIQLNDFSEVHYFIHDIQHFNSRLDNSDIYVGSGLFDHIAGAVDSSYDELIQTPYSIVAQNTPEEFQDITINNIRKYTDDIDEAGRVVFCTEHETDPERIKQEEIRNVIKGIEYFQTDKHYLLSELTGAAVHGPIFGEDFDSEVIRIGEDTDIEFINVDYFEFVTHGEDGFQIELSQIESLVDSLDTEIHDESEFGRRTLEVSTTSGTLDFYKSEYALSVQMIHVRPDDRQEVIETLTQISDDINELSDNELHLRKRDTSAADGRECPRWVLDTNVLYRQRSAEGTDSIADLILNNPGVTGKEILIPWQVLSEINRHKDGSTKQSNLAEVGFDNLNILHILSQFEFFDLTVENVPDNIDNSVIPKTGATDLSLLKKANEESILITDDEALLNIADLSDVSHQDISNIAGPKPMEERQGNILESIKSELRSGPKRRPELLDSIEAAYRSNIQPNLSSMDSGNVIDPEAELDKWMRNGEFIKVPSEEMDDTKIHNTQIIDVVPTYGIIDQIANATREINEDYLLEDHVLESARSAIGRLGTESRPMLNFIVPEQYTYRAEDIDQIGMLFKLNQIENARYESLPHENVNDSFNQIAVKVAKSQNAILLCDANSMDLKRLGGLLNIEVAPIQVNST